MEKREGVGGAVRTDSWMAFPPHAGGGTNRSQLKD